MCLWVDGCDGVCTHTPTPTYPTHTNQHTHTIHTQKVSNSFATGAGAVTATPNPLAAARKLSASKHLLVRNDSYNEMRQQQQAEMAKQMSALPEAGPVGAAPAVTPAPVAVESDKEQADASASGARMAAAS